MFTCPANTVTLVKAALIYNATAGVVSAAVILQASDGLAENVSASTTLAAGASLDWEGWHVLNPGDSVFCYANTVGVRFWISGAVLQGAPLYPSA